MNRRFIWMLCVVPHILLSGCAGAREESRLAASSHGASKSSERYCPPPADIPECWDETE